jgi:hypothetical protein
MRLVAVVLVLAIAPFASAAPLPVYTAAGMGGTHELILENFDFWGGTQAGVGHFTGSVPSEPTWKSLDASGNATFWLTSYSDHIELRLSPWADRFITNATNWGFAFPRLDPEWEALRDTTGPLTFRVLGYTTQQFTYNSGRFRVSVEGQAGSTVLSTTYDMDWKLFVPEPTAWALLAACMPLGVTIARRHAARCSR